MKFLEMVEALQEEERNKNKVLNCSYLAMERMLKEVKILKKDETSCII